jgi:tRNA/rRNA methyltransferase
MPDFRPEPLPHAAAASDALAALAPNPQTRVCFVLIEPSHAGNIGAAARAINAMGFADLRVVNPRQRAFATDPDAIAFASGAQTLLANIRSFNDMPAALDDVTLAIGLSAQGREFAAPPQEIQTVFPRVIAELTEVAGEKVAFVFGTERTGLSIEQALLCQHLCFVETDADSSSLNLAQTVQLVAYLARMALGIRRSTTASAYAPVKQAKDPGMALASVAQVEDAMNHLEQGLIACNFLDPAQPKRLMPRLRRLFSRTRLERAELDIVRGLAQHLIQGRTRP